MPNTEQLLYQTGKNSHWRFSSKNDVLKNFSYSQKKHLRWSLFLIKLPVFRPATLLERDPNTGVFLLRNI